MAKNIDAIVKELVLQAQAASMVAKKYIEQKRSLSKDYYFYSDEIFDLDILKRQSYSIKSYKIALAINLLKQSRHSRIQYKIERKPDQNGCDSNVIYFEWVDNGKKIQFSFHQPNAPYTKQGDYTIKWDRLIGGCKEKYYELRTK